MACQSLFTASPTLRQAGRHDPPRNDSAVAGSGRCAPDQRPVRPLRAESRRARRRHRRRIQRTRRRLRADQGGLRRHGSRSTQSRRRPRDQLFRHRRRQERGGRRRTDRIQPSGMGGLCEAVQAPVPRRRRRGCRVPDRPQWQETLLRRIREAVGRDGGGVRAAARRCREGGRRPAVDLSQCRSARPAVDRCVDRRAERLANLQGGPARFDDGRQRCGGRVAELSRQSCDVEGWRAGKILDRLRGVSLQGRQSAAGDAVRIRDRRSQGVDADTGPVGGSERQGRTCRARQRQDARGGSRDPHGATADVEPDCVRSCPVACAPPADGYQREVPDGTQLGRSGAAGSWRPIC